MNLTKLKGDVKFWNRFAPLYEKWLLRGSYHRVIVSELTQMIEQGWTILDIGAGTGAISIPLSSIGCFIKAVEPSYGMVKIFHEKISSLNIKNIEIYQNLWEDFKLCPDMSIDLLIACNCMHLVNGGIREGMIKAFNCLAKNVCLITEINQAFSIDFKDIDRLQDKYNFLYIKNLTADSTFYFDSMEEVSEAADDFNIDIKITVEGGQIVNRDKTDLAVIWWERK
ncbi:SAM-dependent methyltransferase [Candidatus Magnetoovum chiemensis]|nr:SAM-dependent methyltransferase [Candidatus Magnetoovum chiemensis]